jgi:EpsI family protein
MIGRRDLIFAAGCMAAAGGAYALTPRRQVSLLGARRLADIVPTAFPDWTSADTTDLVSAVEPGSLAARLYGETIGRIYRQTSTGAMLMAMLAHGDTQSDDLQLHRPEVCYPAFGYAITSSRPVWTPLGKTVTIPSRVLVAQGSGHQEVLLYWTRLGEFLPQDRRAQQIDRLRTAFAGQVGDGVLIRFSAVSRDVDAAVGVMQGFAASLVQAVAPSARAALIGTERAGMLRSA